jgi:hypothetical protein
MAAGAMKRADVPADAPVNQIVDWPSLFGQVRRRPGMWLGSTSLTALENLIGGIGLAEYLYDVPEDKRLVGFSFEGFERWVADRFNPERLSLNSFSLARRATDSEERAFYEWFAWYDQFEQDRLRR